MSIFINGGTNLILLIPAVVIPLAFVLMLIGFAVRTRKENERMTEAMEQRISEGEEDLPFEETNATVLQKRADIDQSGKYHRQIYAAEFLTDDGRRVTLEISEEAFQKIQPQETGLLITLNGKFYDFGDGSDV